MAFPTTRWTLLAEATLAGDVRGKEVLDQLCRQYRGPVIAFLEARGLGAVEAEDLVQEFFLSWLRSRSWKRADRERGRFRTFMLGGVLHTLAHYQSRQRAAKRGGGAEADSLDELTENGFEQVCPNSQDAMEFDRGWAVALVDNALAVLMEERRAGGRAAEFEVLRQFLPGAVETPTLEEAATRLGLRVDAVKAAVHRTRARFRELVRAAVARSVAAPHEVAEELQYLRSLLLTQSKRGTPPPQNGKKL